MDMDGEGVMDERTWSERMSLALLVLVLGGNHMCIARVLELTGW